MAREKEGARLAPTLAELREMIASKRERARKLTYEANILEKDVEIADLRAQVAALKSGRQGSGANADVPPKLSKQSAAIVRQERTENDGADGASSPEDHELPAEAASDETSAPDEDGLGDAQQGSGSGRGRDWAAFESPLSRKDELTAAGLKPFKHGDDWLRFAGSRELVETAREMGLTERTDITHKPRKFA
jgi:hypothetical protein